MLSIFKKKTEKSTSEQQDGNKSSLDALQNDGDLQVLNEDRMNKVGGGKSGSKGFDDMFSWNSSCGDTIPQ
jgi:hypothetical protein